MVAKSVKGFTSDAIAALNNYEWPGNVRELENRMKRAVVMSEGGMITAEDLDIRATEDAAALPTLKAVREAAEYDAVTRALAVAQDNISQAAKLLGVSRPTLYDLMKQLHIKNK